MDAPNLSGLLVGALSGLVVGALLIILSERFLCHPSAEPKLLRNMGYAASR